MSLDIPDCYDPVIQAEQRKLERDIREAVVMVQRRRYLDSIPEAQFEPIRKTDRMESV